MITPHGPIDATEIIVANIIDFIDDFIGPAVDETNAWSLNDTSSAGTPTHAILADETAVELAIDNTDELQVCGYDFNDKLVFDIDDMKMFVARFKTTEIAANEQVVIGVGSAWNDAPDSIAEHALFKLDGNMNLLVETDDGTNDNNDKDTTVDLTADTYVWGLIDLSNTADVKFYTSTDGIVYTRRQEATTFDMSNYTAGLQPMFAIIKASGVTTPSVTVDVVRVTSDRPT
jgi:hypothetical protein